VYHSLIWLAVVELLGLLALPLAFRLFSRLPDRGLTFSKVLAILLFTYGAWLLSLTHVVPNSRYTLVVLVLLLAGLSLLVLRRRWREFHNFLVREREVLLIGEVVFLVLFFAWVVIVSHTPEINHTEKPMDFAFLNAAVKSRFFPPADPWLAGYPVSYYHMGHLMMGMLTKLTGIPSSVSYNLAISLIPALAGGVAYGLVYNLVRLSGGRSGRASLYALAGPLLIVLIGNLEGAMEFVYLRGWGSQGFWQWASIKGLHPPPAAQGSVFPDQTWWWWRAARVVDTLDYSKGLADPASLDYTITEFPLFSFVLGDMHPHVLSLPFFLLGVGVVLNLFLSPVRVGFRWLRSHPWQSLAVVIVLGALGFVNLWDLPTLAALLSIALLVKAYTENRGNLVAALGATIRMVAVVLIAAVVFYLPFYLTFESQASGILPVEDVATQPFHYLLVWGFLAFLALSFLGRQVSRLPSRHGRYLGLMGFLAAFVLGPFLLWAAWEVFLGFYGGEFSSALLAAGNRFIRVLPLGVIAGASVYAAFLRVGEGKTRVPAFPLLFLAMGFYLIMGAELFYLHDLFGTRMNTVFKLYYQVWIFLALGGAYGVYYWLSRPIPRRLALKLANGTWGVVVLFLLVVSLYYSVGAVLDKTNGFKGPPTLDGLKFVERSNPSEYEAIKWLRDEAPWGRIVEAVGGSYSEFARVSASTGLPTIIGWEGHEHQWRGSTEPFRGRRDHVQTIYQSEDADAVLALLEQYDIRYVYLGPRERTAYGDKGLGVFRELLPSAFSSGSVVVYERSP